MRKRRLRGVAYSDAMRLAFALAALGPAFWMDVNNAAKKDDCKENLAQLGKAMDTYIKQNLGYFPTMPMYPLKKDDRDDPPSLVKILRKLVGTDEVFMCPTAPDAIQQTGLCYIWNDALNGKQRSQYTPQQLAATWMIADIAAEYKALTVDQLQAYQMTRNQVPMPHVQGFNILYADGSVRWSPVPPKIKVTDIPKNPFEGRTSPSPYGGGSQ